MENLKDLAAFTIIKGVKLCPEANLANKIQSQENVKDAEIDGRRRRCSLVENVNKFLVEKNVSDYVSWKF